MSTNITNQVAFLRTSREFPEDLHQLTVEINKSYLDIANTVNARTIGLFTTNRPAITGESWFITNNQRQQTLRKIYSFGAIAAGATLTIAHGVTGFTAFTKIYAVVTTTAVDYRPVPYVDPITPTTGMTILVDATNIRIVMGATAQPVTSGLAILEWLSNT